jgi:glycosyltransferase involved in cell wall biosynthesis
MRVLYVSGAGVLGGAERVLLDLIAGMRRRGHAVKLVSGEPGPLEERARELGAETEVLPFPARFKAFGESGRRGIAVLATAPTVIAPLAGYLRTFRRAAREWAPDVVHTNGIKAHLLGAWAGQPAPLVWHIHDYVGSRALSSRLLRWNRRRTSGAIANSASVAADITSAIPGLRVWTVPNAVALERFGAEGPVFDLDTAAGLPQASPDVLRVGLIATFAWWKGHDVFLRAMERLPTTLPIRGYIIGGPVYQTGVSQISAGDLATAIASRGLSGRVGLTGFVDDVPAVMRSLDIVVHASTEPEPFGLVIAEAMAAGKPVVVSAVGGAAEIAVGGTDSLVYQPGDDRQLAEHIHQLADNPQLRARLARTARETAIDRFDLDRFVGQVEGIYQQILDGAR